MSKNRINDHIERIKKLAGIEDGQEVTKEKITEFANRIADLDKQDAFMIGIDLNDARDVIRKVSESIGKSMEDSWEAETITVTFKINRKSNAYYSTIKEVAPFSNKKVDELLSECLEVGMSKLASHVMSSLHEVVDGKAR